MGCSISAPTKLTAVSPKTPQEIELLEQEVLSNNGKPIEEVMCMIEDTGDEIERANKEQENKTMYQEYLDSSQI